MAKVGWRTLREISMIYLTYFKAEKCKYLGYYSSTWLLWKCKLILNSTFLRFGLSTICGVLLVLSGWYHPPVQGWSTLSIELLFPSRVKSHQYYCYAQHQALISVTVCAHPAMASPSITTWVQDPVTSTRKFSNTATPSFMADSFRSASGFLSIDFFAVWLGFLEW